MEHAFFNIEAERSVLGSILLEPEVLHDLDLNPDDYYLQSHRLIAETIQELDKKSDPIDLVTAAEFLASKNQIENIGGLSYLSELAGSVPSTANVKKYESIVKKQARKRQIQQTLQEAQQMLFGAEDEEDVEQLANSVISKLTDIDSHQDTGFTHVKDVMVDVVEHASEKRGGTIIGIPSGYPELDELTSGFKPTELIIIGARPSMGKTAFMLNLANTAGKCGALVPIYSLEMGNLSLGQRVLSNEALVNSRKLKIGAHAIDEKEWDRIMYGSGDVSERDILFNDKTGISVYQIRKDLIKLRRQHPERDIICFIDYLQLIKGDPKHKGNRTQEISEISRMLKTTALELNLTIVALSQLSRGVEQRQDKRPMMSDLRESGSIEQDADVVMFLYRDDYYNKDSESKNTVECIVAKQRDGAIGTVSLAFVKEYGRFVNLETRYQG